MSLIILELTDYLLFTVHVVVISINLFGWIFRRTRRLQLVTLSLTLLSWFIFGIWNGWGYCFLTDWEWDIKRKLGETDLPASFVTYLTNNVLGMDLSGSFVDGITVAALVLAIIACCITNYRAIMRNKKGVAS